MKKNIFIIIFFLLFVYVYVSYILLLPDKIILLNEKKNNIRKLPCIDIEEILETSNGKINSSIIEMKLLGKVLLKRITILSVEDISVVPLGKIIGLKLYTNGVLIVGFSELEDINMNNQKTFDECNIKEGDTIIGINELEIDDIKDLKKIVNNSNGNVLNLKLLRDGNIINTSIKPKEVEKNKYQLGLWVKDAATGIGTISFYEPESNMFAALGHGITDSDTNKLINIDSGEVVTSKILNVKKGRMGIPGELKGTIINQNTVGQVLKNTEFGVYGVLNDLTSFNINVQDAIPVAKREEIQLGNATIICTADDLNQSAEYNIEIQKIYYENNYNNKSMQIKITDDALIQKTGGIIRGLSGAPIIQNGKFIGAITNVLVSNPEIGYAVFADMMIKELVN